MQYDNNRLSQHAWDVYINGTFEGYGEGLELESKELEAGLESTNAKNTDSGQTAYAENLGTQGSWWGAWEASGSGNYAKPETQNYADETWSGGCAYNVFSEGNRGDIDFLDQACGADVLVEPEASQGASPIARSNETGALLSIKEVAEVAKGQSEQAGDGDPSGEAVIVADYGPAMSVALPGAHVAPSTEVATDVVEMHGHFTAQHAPKSREAPAGSVMTLVIDAHTGGIIGRHIGDSPVSLSFLGTPTALQ